MDLLFMTVPPPPLEEQLVPKLVQTENAAEDLAYPPKSAVEMENSIAPKSSLPCAHLFL
jgi:hypothetical protein